MTDYASKQPLNLQEVVRELDSRLKVLEPKPKAPVTERVDKMLEDVKSHLPGAKKTEWTPTPPKK